jgi:hypothetical protein
MESVEMLAQYLEEDPSAALVVGYFDDSEAAQADKAVFDEVYEQMGMVYRFATVTSPEVLKETKYTSAVIVHKPVSGDDGFGCIALHCSVFHPKVSPPSWEENMKID